jgi:hypothetical protein
MSPVSQIEASTEGVQDDDQLIKAPSHLSSIETAALPTAGGTAMSALFFGPTPVNCGNDYPHLRYGWCILFRHPTRCRRGRHRNCNLVIRREAQARRAARRYAPDILLLEEYRPFYKMKTEQAREVFNPGLKRNLRFN